MGATSTMIWKMMGVLFLANSSCMLSGAESVPAPPLEMQEIMLTQKMTTIPPSPELETDAKMETQTAKLEDEALNEAQVTSLPETAESVLDTTSSTVTKEIKIDVEEVDTNPSGHVGIPAVAPLDTPSSVPATTPSTTQSPPQQLSALERQSLIGHLVRISDQKSLVLTKRQKLALQQEIRLQNKGYRPFSSASDQEGQPGFPEQPRRIQNFNRQQPLQKQISFRQQQPFDFQQQQQFDFQQKQQFGFQQKQQQQQRFDFQQPQHFVTQQQQQFGSQQQPPFGLQQPQQQPFSPRQTDQLAPQLQQQFQRTNEQVQGQFQQPRPSSFKSLDRVNNIQPQRVFQQDQLSQLQPLSNQIPGQQFPTNSQEAALKQSLLSALQNSFVK